MLNVPLKFNFINPCAVQQPLCQACFTLNVITNLFFSSQGLLLKNNKLCEISIIFFSLLWKLQPGHLMSSSFVTWATSQWKHLIAVLGHTKMDSPKKHNKVLSHCRSNKNDGWHGSLRWLETIGFHPHYVTQTLLGRTSKSLRFLFDFSPHGVTRVGRGATEAASTPSGGSLACCY